MCTVGVASFCDCGADIRQRSKKNSNRLNAETWGNKVTEGVEQSSGNAYSFSPLAG
jgi:hypothetical protein